MALFKRGGVWWYKFYFAGQPIRESSKSMSKTVAKNAEQQRRRDPRFYKCWAGCTKEMIREALGVPIRQRSL